MMKPAQGPFLKKVRVESKHVVPKAYSRHHRSQLINAATFTILMYKCGFLTDAFPSEPE